MAAVYLLRALEAGARGVVGLRDDDQALLRHLDRREVAADVGAAALQCLDLRAELGLERGEIVPDVRVPGDDAHEAALAAAADQDRRPADRFRLADGVPDDAVLALERRPLLGPETAEHLRRFLEGAEPGAERRKRAAIRLELGGEPAGPEPHDRAAAGDVVDRRHLLGQDGRVTEKRRGDERPELHALGDGRHRGELAPGFEDGQRRHTHTESNPSRSNSTAAARASCHVRLICGNVTPNRIRRAMGVPDTSARPRSSTGRSSEADAGGTGLTADQPLAACGPAAACGAPITSRMRFITSTTS